MIGLLKPLHWNQQFLIFENFNFVTLHILHTCVLLGGACPVCGLGQMQPKKIWGFLYHGTSVGAGLLKHPISTSYSTLKLLDVGKSLVPTSMLKDWLGTKCPLCTIHKKWGSSIWVDGDSSDQSFKTINKVSMHMTPHLFNHPPLSLVCREKMYSSSGCIHSFLNCSNQLKNEEATEPLKSNFQKIQSTHDDIWINIWPPIIKQSNVQMFTVGCYLYLIPKMNEGENECLYYL